MNQLLCKVKQLFAIPVDERIDREINIYTLALKSPAMMTKLCVGMDSMTAFRSQ